MKTHSPLKQVQDLSDTALARVSQTLADVALIDAPACAAAGAMSVSWWHEEVRAGRAPQPAIRKPRFTRWRLSQVRAFWAKLADTASADPKTAERVTAQAKRASDKAKAKRAAAQ